MADRSSLSVIVPARDAAGTIGRTLDALAAQDVDDPFEVIVCDDGSSDATADVVRSHGGNVRLVSSTEPGAAAARNTGIAAARGELLAFTDADCFPDLGWLRAGREALTQADLVHGPVLPDPTVARGPFDRTVDFPGGSPWYPAANLFARRTLAESVGGFSELALDQDAGGRRQPLGEDTVFAWQIRRAGGRVRFAPQAIVHHAVVPRAAAEFVRYRRHWRRLPEVVRAVPELRGELMVAGVFLERRTLLFDLALAGAAAALAGRGRATRLAGIGTALPYAAVVVREGRAWPSTPAMLFAAARVAADAVALAALVEGSIRARTVAI